MQRHDVVIVGSGFGGSLLARVLRRLGRDVVLVERGRHPRFALGESATPLAAIALERLARSHGLPDLDALAAGGRWRRELGALGRGEKRGFTFYRQRPGRAYAPGRRNRWRLLVAASPGPGVADSHWLRADVDHHLARRAEAEGVDLWQEVELGGLEPAGEGFRLTGRRGGEGFTARAVFAVDASGPGGFLARTLGLADRALDLPERDLLFAHRGGVGRFADAVTAAGGRLEPGPYEDDDAAVHHLLAEGWMYVLRFAPPGDPGGALTSAGFVLRAEAASRLRAAAPDPEDAFGRLLARYPTVAAQFAGAGPVRPAAWHRALGWRRSRAVGDRWLLLPHAYAFFDPLFSTGIAWTLAGVERAAELLADGPADRAGLARYGELLAAEADHLECLVALAWRLLGDFRRFAALTHLYFAAASFHEARQRLVAGDPAWEGFLGATDEAVAPRWREARERLGPAGPGPSPAAWEGWVRRAIAPRNVAGLADPRRANLYPVDTGALVAGAHLLGLAPEEARSALARLRRP